MADIQQALCEYLLDDGGVTALCGTRIYPEAVPMAPAAADFPRILFRQEGKDQPRSLSSGATRQPRTRLAVVCQGWGPRGYADAQALAVAVANATGGNTGGQRLEDFGQAWMGQTSKLWVKAVALEDVLAHEPDQAPAANPKRVHGVELMLAIDWNERAFP